MAADTQAKANQRHLLDLRQALPRALTLGERALLPRGSGSSRQRQRALKLGDAWQAQPPFNREPHLRDRLASLELDPDSFRSLLASEPLLPEGSAAHGWSAGLVEAFTAIRCDGVEESEELGLLEVVRPLIDRGRERLRAGLLELESTHRELPFGVGAELLFLPRLLQTLAGVVEPTMVLELNVARLEGRLRGDSPEERFGDFVRQLTESRGRAEILAEYPVLARQSQRAVQHWVEATGELLRRLATSWPRLRHTFQLEGPLVGVVATGDPHRRGQRVHVLTFEGGRRVVYKPRSVTAEARFQGLLAWLNAAGAPAPFRTLSVVEGEHHGWVEFVRSEGCSAPSEIERYYERLGGLLALFYALDATDFHFENLIAAGEQPVAVDLEALFHPQIEGFDCRRLDGPSAISRQRHVLRVGLLPQPISAEGATEGFDLTAMGATPDQLLPGSRLGLADSGRDVMRFTPQAVRLGGGAHQPRLGEGVIGAAGQRRSLLRGFEAIYNLLLEERQALIGRGGPLAAFEGVEVRCVLRDTQVYAALLGSSFHPDLLRDALDRDRHLDHLWVEVAARPFLSRVVGVERRALERHDVPIFTTTPGSRDLKSCDGSEIRDALHHSSLERVRRGLERLGPEDLRRQRWLIRSALETLDCTPSYRPRRTLEPAPEAAAGAAPEAAAAEEIGERLEGMALLSGDEAHWLGIAPIDRGTRWSVQPLGWDLYGGFPGVALFFAYLGSLQGDERWERVGRAAIRVGEAHFAAPPPELGVGLFSGIGGWIYTLTHLGVLWRDEGLLALGHRLAYLVEERIEEDRSFDVIDGSSGLLLALLALYQARPDERLLTVAQRAGTHLRRHARVVGGGVAWSAGGSELPPLAGLSHGTSGIALSVARLGRAVPETGGLELARAALRYEDTLFDPGRRNWVDVRNRARTGTGTHDDRFMSAWCHGAAGIGWVRSEVSRLLDGASAVGVRSKVGSAVETTLRDGFGWNHSLCHGDLGNLDFLLAVCRAGSEPGLETKIGPLAAAILDDGRRHGWRCGLPFESPVPGLMMGLAGIGYQLLRLSSPDRVPSLLSAEPPVCDPGRPVAV